MLLKDCTTQMCSYGKDVANRFNLSFVSLSLVVV